VQGKGWSEVTTLSLGIQHDDSVPHAVTGCAAMMLDSTGAAVAHATNVTVPKEGTLVADGTDGTGENTTAVEWSRSWVPRTTSPAGVNHGPGLWNRFVCGAPSPW
jgi:hypothetical protein